MPPQMKTLSIQQVSQRLGVPKHTLRFWEKELEGIIAPNRTNGKQRRYTLEDLLVIQEVKSLKEQGLKLEDIRSKLNNRFKFSLKNSKGEGIEELANRIAELVRLAIHNFFEGKILE
jgi:DNA-binding transcriptional MerR regulator